MIYSIYSDSIIFSYILILNLGSFHSKIHHHDLPNKTSPGCWARWFSRTSKFSIYFNSHLLHLAAESAAFATGPTSPKYQKTCDSQGLFPFPSEVELLLLVSIFYPKTSHCPSVLRFWSSEPSVVSKRCSFFTQKKDVWCLEWCQKFGTIGRSRNVYPLVI